MVCDKCGVDIDTVKCHQCGEMVLRLGSFCYRCGVELVSPDTPKTEEADEPDFSARILCSDGTCIGVINEEGICKVCGKRYSPDV